MGRWGDGFFEGDLDFDMAGDLSHLASCELVLIGVPADKWDTEEYPSRSLDETRHFLDNVSFDLVFDLLRGKRANRRYIVTFAALCMQIGVRITDARMKYLRRIYRRSGIWGRMIQQFKDALDGYESGTPWDFGSKSLIETANDLAAAESSASQPVAENVENASSNGKDKKGDPVESNSKRKHADAEAEAEAPREKVATSRKKVKEWLEDDSHDEREGFPKTKRVKLTNTD